MNTIEKQVQSLKSAILARINNNIAIKEKKARDKTQGKDFLIQHEAELDQMIRDRKIIKDCFESFGF